METEKRAALSKAEFAAKLGVSKDSVNRAILKNKIKIVRFGRRVLIPVSELSRIVGGL
jgi:excisionase family DNA binding protein